MNTVIIVAGGSGSRFKSNTPKQFLKINKKEILSYSVNTFLIHNLIDDITIVVHKDWIEHVKLNYPNCKVVIGGSSRSKSVYNGLKSISNKTNNILIHDAARPFITNSIITSCIDMLETSEVVAPILNMVDSIIQIKNNNPIYLDRDSIKSVQTPQCIKKHISDRLLLSNSYDSDEIENLLKIIPNIKLSFTQGSYKNLKITTKQDLDYLNYLIND